METTNTTSVNKDVANKRITVVREFDAPVEQVWKAWTQQELLDNWWAPKPWKAKTKKMDFRPGGYWLYAMIGPQGEEHWARVDFNTIEQNRMFTAEDYFSDENGNRSNDMPGMKWRNSFTSTGSGTKVTVEITFASEQDMNKILEMGFEEGFTSALGNLDEVL